MTPSIHLVNTLLLYLLPLALIVGSPMDADVPGPDSPLRLMGEAQGRTITDISIVDGVLVERTAASTAPLPRGVRWRLEGSLRANAELVSLEVFHKIYTVPEQPPSASARTAQVATMLLGREEPWSTRLLKGAVAVFVWVIDGRAHEVLPVATTKAGGFSSHWAAAAALKLSERTKAGYPAVLVWRDGTWMRPKPKYTNDEANAALCELAFGSPPDFEVALRTLLNTRSGARRELEDLTRLAATFGAVSALQSLLEVPVDLRRDPIPLWRAAAHDRDQIIPILLAAGADVEAVESSMRSAVDRALSQGHLSAALALPGKRSPTDLGALLALAIEHGNTQAVDSLLGDSRTPKIRTLDPHVWSQAVVSGDPRLVDLMLTHGVPADAKIRGRPLLVIASACGHREVVRALVDAGAPVDQMDAGTKITPLMASAMHADPGIATLLLDAGASVKQTDRWGNNALSYALAWQRPAVAQRLVERGAQEPPRKPLRPEAEELRKGFAAFANHDAAIHDSQEIDLPPVPTYAPPADASRSEGPAFRQEVRTSTVPIARPLERGSPIVMAQRIDVITTGSYADESATWALVSVVVEPDGSPSGVTCIAGYPDSFLDAARRAAERYRFLPGEVAGAPVRARVYLPIRARP